MAKRERHHCCFPRNLWTSSEELLKIRRTKELIVPLEPVTHNQLHRNIGLVPAPEHHMANRIAKEFYPVRNDYIASIGNLILSVVEARDNVKTQYLERMVGNLIIESLEMQLLFIGTDYNGTASVV